ncbi:dihydrolipoamide acetyltransferase family protein [Pseudalkalibacillus hwajinpoensis]|uniref:Dihydrolipoamide acetyltransferase component of pyruvate dehydrogenase complex n=1 Tax=Guptibacillus hwajinpoensis TaxID=208199 RepID=A0A4U1MEF1_9BACL|nr:dihydrolipoamide acetyltransferase family protein [Pseudalkalibacillus hwajinpoensis]TKD68745.1 2-oxo acid dehydrogenase subunit E2 [Pseudalkalibacillus hwajinpoensis]
MEVKLHDIGEGMSEGEIVQILVNAGDHVTVDQPLVEVQTDKVTAELPSPFAGRIESIFVSPGDVIEVGGVLLTISPIERANEVKTKINKSTRILAAPFTRKIARENGIDIETIKGSGPAGRILDEDVMKYIGLNHAAQPEPLPSHKEKKEAESDSIPFTSRRKQIAAKMTKSVQTIPHVTHFDEVDVTNVLEIKNMLAEKRGISLSVAAFYIKAVCVALKDFSVFNSELREEESLIYLKKDIHIGIATDTDEGLIVPVIHHCDRLSIQEIHVKMKQLRERALKNELGREDLSSGTFTISNAGPLGSTGATPIINYPEVALLAFHKTKKRPVVTDEDEIVIRSMMNLSMTFDHRITDGGTSMRFTNRIIELIEHPSLLLTELV